MGRVQLLKASAGSGKTFRLVYEYVRAVMEDPALYRHILAVTFTNKATAEMKWRILQEVDTLARGRESAYAGMLAEDLHLDPERIAARAKAVRGRILHDYSRFSVLTIDKFFQRIIRSFIRELGLDPAFSLELATESLLSQAADLLIDSSGGDPHMRQQLAAFAEENIGQGRKWNIKEGLTSLGKHIFTERYRAIAETSGAADAAEAAGRAFAKADRIAGELRQKAARALEEIGRAGLRVADFPYGQSGFANYFNKIAEGVFEIPKGRVSEALGSDEKWYSKTSPHKHEIIALTPVLRPLLEDICAEVERELPFLNSVVALRRNYRNYSMLGSLSARIAEICRDQGIMPISETNNILHRLVSDNDAPFIFEKAGNHFSRYMIDEFQDTSRLQWGNFVPLLRNALAQSDGSPALLVGDVKQSIYRWRGGDWRILAGDVAAEFGQVDESGLTTNYRSLPLVVEFNNTAVAECVKRDNESLNAGLDGAAEDGSIGADTAAGLRDMLSSAYAGHAQQSRKAGEGYVTVDLYDGDVPPVVERIEELQERGYAPGDIAVLVRTKKQGVEVADMLLERKNSNPGSGHSYDVVTQEALLIDSSPAVRFTLACFRLSASQSDNLATAVYNNFHHRSAGDALHGGEREFLASLRLLPPSEAFEAVVERFRLDTIAKEVVYLQALHEQILDFTARVPGDIPLFVKWWEEEGAAKSVNLPQDRSAITVITIHKAKGLQYKAVVIPYCDWPLNPKAGSLLWAEDRRGELSPLGPVPVNFSESLALSAFADDYWNELVLSHVDNVNLFYVAATRAEQELHLMMSAGEAKKKKNSIGGLLMQGISVSGGEARIGDIEGRLLGPAGDAVRIGFGSPIYPAAEAPVEGGAKVSVPYASYRTDERLRLRMPSGRYVEEGVSVGQIAPRDYGVLMHKVFENAVSRQDIDLSIAAMVADGMLAKDEETVLRSRVADALNDPQVASWFEEGWEQVRNESDIIIPRSISVRRPDRVMTRGGRAVVVDYKFGLNRPSSHRRQVAHYMELLREMGYREVEGYLWYFSLGDVVPVAQSQ